MHLLLFSFFFEHPQAFYGKNTFDMNSGNPLVSNFENLPLLSRWLRISIAFKGIVFWYEHYSSDFALLVNGHWLPEVTAQVSMNKSLNVF